MISKKALFSNLIGPILVCFTISIVTIYYYGLTNPENWKAPPIYGSGDGVWILKMMDAVANGELLPFKPFIKSELAAPFSAEYSDWPTGIVIEMLPAGLLINLYGIAFGANLYLILCHAAAGLSMFLCLRFLHVKVLWAFTIGVAFGLCPFVFLRGFSHLSLVNTVYLIPIVISAACFLFKNNLLECKKTTMVVIVFLSIFMGTQLPYYSAIYLWVVTFAALFWTVRIQSIKILVPYFIFLVCFAIGFAVSYSPTLLHILHEGKNFEAVTRYYAELQKLALRPIELFLPGSASGIPLLSQLSAFYENQCLFRSKLEFSESMKSYLGLVGLLGFFILLMDTFYRIATKRDHKISGWFWFLLFILAYSVVGGLNGFIGLGKFYMLRASNRYSIYILGIVLIFLAVWLSSSPVLRKKWIRLGIAGILLVLGTIEPILPRLLGTAYHTPQISLFESDKKFSAEMEKQLPNGAMVFNYPVIQIPERGTYAYFRPSFFTDKIRYSFGALVGRASETWQLEVEKLPVNEMVEKLKEYGFNGILIYKGADLSEEMMLAAKQASDYFKKNRFPLISSPFGDFEFFAFDPNPSPLFPPVQPMYVNNWWSERIQPAGIEINSLQGEYDSRWASHASAMVEVFNEQTDSRRLSLRGGVLGATQSDLQIYVDRKMVFSGKISPNTPLEFSTESIEVAGHKAVRFEFRTDQKPTVREGRKFSFAVGDLEAIWEKK